MHTKITTKITYWNVLNWKSLLSYIIKKLIYCLKNLSCWHVYINVSQQQFLMSQKSFIGLKLHHNECMNSMYNNAQPEA